MQASPSPGETHRAEVGSAEGWSVGGRKGDRKSTAAERLPVLRIRRSPGLRGGSTDTQARRVKSVPAKGEMSDAPLFEIAAVVEFCGPVNTVWRSKKIAEVADGHELTIPECDRAQRHLV